MMHRVSNFASTSKFGRRENVKNKSAIGARAGQTIGSSIIHHGAEFQPVSCQFLEFNSNLILSSVD